MFVALTQAGRLLNLIDESPKDRTSYRCPGCKEPVRLKAGSIVRPHFSHVRLKDCHYHSENESQQHLHLKAALYQWLTKTETASLEHHLPALHQIADLFVNDQLALEVQCSSLSVAAIQKRTAGYREAGLQVRWLLGKDLWLKGRLTKLHKQFLYFSSNMGFHLWELDEVEKVVRLRYLIHEDWHGRVQCLTRFFPFGVGSFLDILRLPYAQQEMVSFEGQLDQELQTYIAQQLHYRTPKWMQRQETAYLKGENLLTQPLSAFYPQVRLPESAIGFAQIDQDLSPVYDCFLAYYSQQAKKDVQILYPPAYYCQK